MCGGLPYKVLSSLCSGVPPLNNCHERKTLAAAEIMKRFNNLIKTEAAALPPSALLSIPLSGKQSLPYHTVLCIPQS